MIINESRPSCAQGLQLVAPLLADAIDADGEFSLRIDEFHLPIGAEPADQEAIRIEGELELHRASIALKNTIASKISTLVMTLLGNAVPERMTVAQGVEVGFQVLDGRIHHQGLAFLLPHGDAALEIVSHGSVGLDETLDLQVSIQLPPGLLGQSAIANRLTGQPIEIAIGGTVDQPKVGLPERMDWIRSIEGLISGGADNDADDPDRDRTDGETPAGDGSLEGAVTDIIGGLLEGISEREEPILDQPILPRLRERIRDRPLLPRRRRSGNE